LSPPPSNSKYWGWYVASCKWPIWWYRTHLRPLPYEKLDEEVGYLCPLPLSYQTLSKPFPSNPTYLSQYKSLLFIYNSIINMFLIIIYYSLFIN
jgi:hypothetical protein